MVLVVLTGLIWSYNASGSRSKSLRPPFELERSPSSPAFIDPVLLGSCHAAGAARGGDPKLPEAHRRYLEAT